MLPVEALWHFTCVILFPVLNAEAGWVTVPVYVPVQPLASVTVAEYEPAFS
jgi:predicted membrane-bound mannosyltransferase